MPSTLPLLRDLGSHPDPATNSQSPQGHGNLFCKPAVKGPGAGGGGRMGPDIGGSVGSCLLPNPSEVDSRPTGQNSRGEHCRI